MDKERFGEDLLEGIAGILAFVEAFIIFILLLPTQVTLTIPDVIYPYGVTLGVILLPLILLILNLTKGELNLPSVMMIFAWVFYFIPIGRIKLFLEFIIYLLAGTILFSQAVGYIPAEKRMEVRIR